MRKTLFAAALTATLLVPAQSSGSARYLTPVICDKPTGCRAGTCDPPLIIKVGIAADGKITWNAAPISVKQFAAFMKNVGDDAPIPIVQLLPAPKVQYQTLEPILHTIQDDGVREIWFGDFHYAPPDKKRK